MEEVLEGELTRLQRLPPHSAYAMHRLRVVRRALELLRAPAKSQEQRKGIEDELTQLLLQLSLTP